MKWYAMNDMNVICFKKHSSNDTDTVYYYDISKLINRIIIYNTIYNLTSIVNKITIMCNCTQNISDVCRICSSLLKVIYLQFY